MNDTIHIDIARVLQNLKDLAQFGGKPGAGINRALGDESYRQSYAWLRNYWAVHLHLPVETDAIANLWVRRPGSKSLPAIAIGSHHDAVRNGGRYDGALGVLLATEVLETLKEHGIITRHPLWLVSFTAEEPNPFNLSTLGSKVISGRLHAKDLLDVRSLDGSTLLADVIGSLGGNLPACDGAAKTQKDIAAFLECHIEQSKRLDERTLSLASVSCITGIYRENIRFIGEANHSGTTRPQDRKDALSAAAAFLCAFESIINSFADQHPELVGTVGYLDVFPNSANIIPCEVTLLLEIRSCDAHLRVRAIEQVSAALEQIRQKRGIRTKRRIVLDQPEQMLNDSVRAFLNQGIQSVGEPVTELTSMAGHDAANMQKFTKAGMLFVRSIGGKSHCFDEQTDSNDIEKAGDALLHTVLQMDKEMNAYENNLQANMAVSERKI